MRKYLLGFILITSLLSCDRNRVFEDNIDQPGAFWLADSVARFKVPIDDPNIEYNILLNIRNGLQFPHSNIYVKYHITDSLGRERAQELRNFELFNTKTGYPLGNGTGDIFESQFVLLKNYVFDQAGTYNIDVQQYMRYDSLPEVYSVGVRVEKSIE